MSEVEEFAQFVATHQPSLRRTAFLVCGDWDLASDYVQEGLIRVFRRWRQLEHGDALSGYARKAVVSAALDARRRREWGGRPRAERSTTPELAADASQGSRSGAAAAGLAPGAVATAEAGSIRQWEERRAMVEALTCVPIRQRACVVLRFYEDLSVAQTAAVLGVSEGTVKSQTARGLDALRMALKAQGAGHGA